MLKSADDLLETIERYGFLPFFKNQIQGFSIEEMCSPEFWSTELDGPWEWKGPAIRSGRCIYGRFFSGKAGFVSKDWLPDFVNYRRNGYDLDALYDEGLVAHKDKTLYDIVKQLEKH